MKLLSLMFIVLLVSCNSNSNDLKKSIWKFYEGSHKVSGDVFSFQNLELKNDTLFYQKKPQYFIVNYKNRYFIDEFITIRSLNTNEIATFIKK
jgi:hypothetical protein